MTGPSILVVDDEPFMRRIVRQTLSNIGIAQVTEAESAKQAEGLFAKESFDLVICDIYMPNMSGLELLKKIRSGLSSAPNDSRLIFLTSFSNTEVLKTSMELDVNGFMVKPIKSDLVKKKILRALNEKMFLKDAEMYEAIDIDTQWTSKLKQHNVIAVGSGIKHTQEQPEQRPDKQQTTKQQTEIVEQIEETSEEQLPEGVKLESILQLTPGAILAEDLIAKDGTLLLSAGHEISPQMVNRLHDLQPILRSDFIKIEIPDDDEEENEQIL